MMQLGYAAATNHLLTYDEPIPTKINGMTFDDAVSLVMRRILESREAWE
jgi:hypothetical protein